jgi:alpha-beta hydrolase superfamily lysophospholipase
MTEFIIEDSLGDPISGILSIPEGASSVVVMSHGYSSSKDSTIYREMHDKFNSGGIGTVRYDYYGHPGPEYGANDDVTLSGAVNSLMAVVAHVRESGDYNIGLIGASFGGLLSIIVSSQDKGIEALALKSPVTEPIKFWTDRINKMYGEGGFEKWKNEGIIHYQDRVEDFYLLWDFWLDLNRFDTLNDARKISCPTLIVHAEKDTICSNNPEPDAGRSCRD